MPFPNSHKYYWDLPMYSKSFGVLQKFYSLKIEPVMWGGWWVGGWQYDCCCCCYFPGNQPAQHSTQPLGRLHAQWLARDSTLHVWASFCGDRVDTTTSQPATQPRKHIPIYFLLLGPRFPPNTRWLSSLPKGNSPIIAQLLRCHDIHENDGGMENAPNIRSY